MRYNKSKRLHQNLQKFKSKKIDFGSYVKEYYLENGLAYISMNICGYYDVIDRYSVPEYEWLNSHFAEFLEQNAYYIPTEYPIVLEICGGNLTEQEKKTIEETVRDHYSLKLGDKQADIDAIHNKSFMYLLIATLFAIIVTLLDRTSIIPALKETFLIFFWVFAWDLVELWLFERQTKIQIKTEAAQLASIKVIFSERFRDNQVDIVVADGYIAEIFEEEKRLITES